MATDIASSMVFHNSLMCAALVAFTVCSPIQDRGSRACVRYEPDTVRITGTLTRRTFYGAPGFGEDPKQDEKETGFYLQLASPICTTSSGDEVNMSQTGIRLVQILLDRLGYDRLRKSLGRTIALRGTLSGAMTGHHHARVLLTPVHPIHVER